jgi:hypothetical protein
MNEFEIEIIKKQIAINWDKYIQMKKVYEDAVLAYNNSRLNSLTGDSAGEFNVTSIKYKQAIDKALMNWKIEGHKDEVEILLSRLNTEAFTVNNDDTPKEESATEKGLSEDETNRLNLLWDKYEEKQNAYQLAENEYDNLKKNALSPTRSADVHNFSLNGSVYKQKIETALNDWKINGHKQEVEELLKKNN